MSRDHRFPAVPSGYPFPRLEKEVLSRWQAGEIFRKTLEKPAQAGRFVLYDGPPTANNVPHVGHVVTRVIKDLYPRFRTMQGYHAPRKAGWDTHGLPVEIEVEKQLGFSGKQEIEDFGIARFNERCLESVHTYERQWRTMTERVGYWTDMDDAYFTYTNEYVESVWWALKTLHERELLVEGYKIQPYCARCGTTLSSHEVAQNYKEADDPSVWVRFPLRPGQEAATAGGGSWRVPEEGRTSVVAWTTTPWTLLSHVALAVHPELTYKLVADPVRPGETLLIAEGLETAVPVLVERDGQRGLDDLRQAPAAATFRGSDLVGLRYDRPFATRADREPAADGPLSPPPSDEAGFAVVAGDYVTLTDGTGIVHTAPLYGEDDYQTGLRYGLPLVRAVGSEGTVRDLPGVEAFTGRWFKDADSEIQRDLKQRGLLLHADQYRHNYPFCWRCDRPLLYYAWDSWFVATTKRRDELIAQNRTIGWHPAHVGEGRFGNWLENVVDWALSRNRYWGTPLPVWRCNVDGCGHVEVVGSYAELFEKAGRPLPEDVYDREQFDPHRPFVDRVWKDAPEGWEPFTWACPRCREKAQPHGKQGTMGRVEEVIDAWFDSGSMPFAQYHYPFENKELTEERFPADLISEAVDQTRGWFYTLHVLGTLLFGSHAYDNCIVLGHVNDEDGRKMSKRLGNVVEPMSVMEETGADALRWYFCVNNPTASSRFSARLVREAAQGFLLPLWNALSFFTIYANLDGWRPPVGGEGGGDPDFATRPPLDRWVLLRLDRLVREVTEHLEGYRTTEAAKAIETFIEELTNWYIRRSRDRFWAPGGEGADPGESAAHKDSAYRALYEVLTTLARLLAPFTPFLAEVLHDQLVKSQGAGAESIHLEDWAEPRGDRSEEELEEAMAAIQRIVRLGHAARNTHSIKTRQPLAAVTLVAADEGLPERIAPYEDLLQDELNVHAVRWAEDRTEYVHHEVRPVFPKAGPRFGKQMKEVQAALAAADGDALAAALEEHGKITLELSTGPADLSTEEVEVRLVEREGTATQGDRELLVALETELDDELVAEGRAREVVHLVQTARKEMDLDYADRIRVRYATGDELAAAVAAHREGIAGDTLAVALEAVPELTGDASSDAPLAGARGGATRSETRNPDPHESSPRTTSGATDMAGIFKAYDIRGIYGEELDETLARRIGLAYQHVLGDEDRAVSNTVVVGRDMRSHSTGLAEALIDGLTAAGLDVVDVGLVTTPMNYFAVGHLKAAGGIQVTASHNPARYNGFKLSRRGARPVSGATKGPGKGGIELMEERIAAGDLPVAQERGRVTRADVMDDYREHILAHLDRPAGGAPKRLRVVADAANGMGTIYRPILEAMGIELELLYFELDGSFPNHEANPLKEENLRDLQAAVTEHGADLGVSFDGDADRSAFIDETGRAIGSDLITAIIGGELLERQPGSAIVYDLRSSKALAEYVREKGGEPIRERVGHSFMKATLREHEGIFGGELAGHYYFRDNYYADSSILAVVEILNLLRATGKPLSALVEPLRRYAKSPEINFEVEDKQGKIEELAKTFSDGEVDYLDGISVRYPTWWFNVRPSNTEPYLRLVLEADTEAELAERKAQLFAILGEPAD